MTCTSCGSDNLTRLSLLWERGTTVTTSAAMVTTGVAQSATMVAKNVSQTHAAVSASPPRQKGMFGWLLLLVIYGIPTPLIGLCIMTGVIPGLGVPVGFCTLAIGVGVDWLIWKQIARISRWNSTECQRQLSAWQASYQCNRCAAIGIPS